MKVQSQRLAKCWPYFLKYSDFQRCLPFYHNLSLPMKFSHRCACDDILNLLSLNSPGWANQLVTSSHKQHSSLFIHNCLCRWFLFGGISFRISSQGDIFPSEFIGNRIFGYNGIYTSRIEAVTRTEVVHYLFPIYDLINLLWFWFRFYCNCINALHQALKGSEIVLFILIEREI